MKKSDDKVPDYLDTPMRYLSGSVETSKTTEYSVTENYVPIGIAVPTFPPG